MENDKKALKIYLIVTFSISAGTTHRIPSRR